MKRGYLRLLLFEILILFILILNSFAWNILSGLKMTVFLILMLVVFKFFLGIEKDRHRYAKDVIVEVLIFLVIFFIAYYALGLLIGFARTENYLTWTGITTFIIPSACYIILREVSRYTMMCKAEGNRALYIVTTALFILMDITSAIYYNQFSSSYETFIFIALSLLPAVSANVVFSYMTLNTGYKPIIVYSLIIGLYQYLLPIIPNPSEYLVAVITFLLPIILAYRVYLFLLREKDEDIDRDYRKRHYGPMIVSSILIIAMVYFTSGYFHYHAVAIASGSMSPRIHKGDVAVIEKMGDNYEDYTIGQVVAYKYDNIMVVHRLVNIVKDDGKYYFYSKGDANNSQDNYTITEDMMYGVVHYKIPYLGLPTVWLNEL